jgi:hypothetical protein
LIQVSKEKFDENCQKINTQMGVSISRRSAVLHNFRDPQYLISDNIDFTRIKLTQYPLKIEKYFAPQTIPLKGKASPRIK